MILVIATHRSSNRIVGFRLLDTETTKVLDVAYDKVLKVVSEHEGYVSNIKYNKEKKTIDTNFSKYPIMRSNQLYGKSPIIIIEKSIENRYRVADYRGNMAYMDLDYLVEYSVTEGLANGEVVTSANGMHIVQVNGKEFPDDEIRAKAKGGKDLVNIRKLLGKNDYNINENTFFAYASDITKTIEVLRIGEGVIGIEQGGFHSLSNLKEVFMSDTIKKAGSSSFAYCNNLEKVTLSNNLKVIENTMFRNCKKLKSIYLPPSVIVVEHLAFQGCTSLREVHMSRKCKVEYGAIPSGVRIRYY